MFPTLDAALLERWAGAAVAALERHRARDRPDQRLPGRGPRHGHEPAAHDACGSGRAAAWADPAGRRRGGARPRGAAGRARQLRGDPLPGAARAWRRRWRRRDGPVRRGGAGRRAHPRCPAGREGRHAAAGGHDAHGARRGGGRCGGRADRTGSTWSPRGRGEAAGTALRATPDQLPELARAGVVDAGGIGLVVVLDALAALARGRDAGSGPGGAGGGLAAPAGRGALAPEPAREPGYEVMYLLDGCDDARAAALRAALDGLGDAAAVVGDGAPGGTGTWTVHVHCADIGAALEAGMAAGRPHGVRVMPLVEPRTRGLPARPRRARRGLRAGGGGAGPRGGRGRRWCATARCRATGRPTSTRPASSGAGRHRRAARRARWPCDAALAPVAERAAAAARRAGQEVVVVPTASVVAGLAALAVHDPGRHAADDVVAMTEAAAGTRVGSAAGRRRRRRSRGPARACRVTCSDSSTARWC